MRGHCLATLILTASGVLSAGPAPASALESAATGRTLTVLTARTEINYDPAVLTQAAVSLHGLVLRRLTTWDVRPGEPTRVVPDLATDTGRSSDGGRTWTYTLKAGLKYEDGTPITSADIKYGVERSFAPEHTGGLGYHKALLTGGADYRGPYAGSRLASIETPDPRRIVFRLRMAYQEWPWIASMPAFVPVPQARDDDPATYGDRPVASGPYMYRAYQPGIRLELLRNPHWDRATDQVRTAEPDRIVMELGVSAQDQAQRMIADRGADRDAIAQSGIPPEYMAQVRGDPAVRGRVLNGGPDRLNYLAVNTRRGALKLLKVRQAIQYAVDKQAFRETLRGTLGAVRVATTLLPPGTAGRVDYNLYATDPSGDVPKARKLLADAGHPDLKLTLRTVDDEATLERAGTIQRGLARAGITVTLKPVTAAALAASLSKDTDYDLCLYSWLADFPSPAGNLQPLFASSETGGGHNMSQYANPAVDAAMDRALAEPDRRKAEAQWARLDERLMRDAAAVPLINTGLSVLNGSNIRNFVVSSTPQFPDMQRISLAA
ncbi:ABC transporter substrate-binding protein [Actinoplanes aureus]|uniref:ABC transporter substrate-binding protein n=1 Tax=Actinoplanes aureus TaxID=2792083 RepID=A0A931C132_9ACTN|nr:ABC transporter substrate-binding protein [Actinoplanes aureus]MBG0561350.1 ABC transporter substrate-binding protein [Actinoplanes aureus]